MALERKLISFDGGMRDIPHNKPLNCADEIINYEQIEMGILQKRIDPIVFESSFDSMVRQTFNVEGAGNIVEYAPEPFYPANLPSDIADGYDYLIPVYGNTGGTTYKLYLFYKANRGGTDGWYNIDADGNNLLQGIYDDGVVFTADSKLRYSYDKNLLYVADDVNNLFFITTDKDGVVVSAKCGIPPSKSRPIITPMDGWESKYFEEDDITDSLGDIGLIRVLYNCVTKEGYKGNPSPASEFVDFQWIKLDDGSQDRWLKKFQVTNVKIPDNINNYIKDELKYFDFYFEILRYSEGVDAEVFGFSCRKEIFDKDSANSYSIVIPPSSSILASWEEDVAPVAKDVVAFDGKVVLAQVKDKLKFPFEFDNIWEIKLNNQDNITAVNGVIKIRLYDEDATSDPANGVYPIEGFKVLTYCPAGAVLQNRDKIRIYDSDLTTPIMADWVVGGFYGGVVNAYIDLFISVPQLQAGNVHNLYLCFGGDGVDSDYNTILYGKFWSSGLDDWSDQKVFADSVRCVNENALLAIPIKDMDNFPDKTTKLINKANTELYIRCVDGQTIPRITSIAKLPEIGETVGDYATQLDGTPSLLYNYECELSYSKYTYIAYVQLSGSGANFNEIIKLYDSSNDGIYVYFNNITNKVAIHIEETDGGSDSTDTSISFSDSTNYFVAVSINFDNEMMGILLINCDSNAAPSTDTLDLSSYTLDDLVISKVEVGYAMAGNKVMKIDEIQLINNYFDVDDSGDVKTLRNIANFMPAFTNMIGYDYSTPNNNITFEKVDNSLKAKNILRWSKKGGYSFPDTYYKSGLPSPVVRTVLSLSTLALQSQNVIKIYLRNGLYKFIASGDPSTWADLSDNLIRQNPRFGILQQDALAVTPFGDYHLSEAGVVEWLGDRLRVVTNKRTEDGEFKIMNIPLDKVYKFYYIPLRNQLFIQELYEETYLTQEDGYFITTEDGKKIKVKL